MTVFRHPGTTNAPVVVAAAASFALLLGSNMPTALYVEFARELRFETFTLTTIYAVYFIAIVPTLLVFGGLSDRVGRRPVVQVGLVAALAGAAAFALADSVAVLLLARALQGVAVGLLSGALAAVLIDASPRRGSTVSTVSILAGGTLGPLVGGVVSAAAPGAPGHPFWLVVAAIAAILAATALLPDVRPPRPATAATRASLPPGVWLGAGVAGLGWATAGLSLGLLPTTLRLVAPGAHPLTATVLVTTMMGLSAVTQIVVGRTTLPLARVAVVVVPLATTAMAVGLATGILALITVGSALSGIGLGCAFLGGMRLAAAAAPQEQRARVLSVFFAATYLATGLPTFGVGALSAAIGLLPAIAVFAAVVVLASAVVGFALSHRGREATV